MKRITAMLLAIVMIAGSVGSMPVMAADNDGSTAVSTPADQNDQAEESSEAISEDEEHSNEAASSESAIGDESDELSSEEDSDLNNGSQTDSDEDETILEAADEIIESEGPAKKDNSLLGIGEEPSVNLYITESEGEPIAVTSTKYSGTGWEYDASSNTLTLNGFQGQCIECDGSLNIYLKGTNIVTLPGTISKNTYGIMTGGTLTIDADEGASLDVKCELTTVHYNNIFLINSDIVMNGGTLNLNGERKNCDSYSLYGISGRLTLNENSSLNMQLDTDISCYGISNGLISNTTGNSNITINNTPSNHLYCLGGLKVTGEGEVTVNVPDGCSCVEDSLIIGEEAGKITLNGRVCVRRNSAFSRDSASYYLDIPGNKAVTNHMSDGYTWAGLSGSDDGKFWLQTLTGENIENAVIDTPSDTSLAVMKNSFTIPGLKVEERYNSLGTVDMIIAAVIRGGKKPYSYSVTSGSLPEGLTLNDEFGYISGIPTSPVSSGSVTVTVTDADNNNVDVTVNYGTVIEKIKYLYVGNTQVNLSENVTGAESKWSYDKDSQELTLNGYSGGPIFTDDMNNLTINIKGNNTITIPSDSTEESPFGIAVNSTVTIEAETGATLNINCDTSQEKNINLINADVIVNGGNLIINGKNSSTSGTLRGPGRLTLNSDASFDMTLDAPYSCYGIFFTLTNNSSGDCNILIKNTLAGNLYCIGTLVQLGSGNTTITVPDGGNCIEDSIKIAENAAGTVTLNGKVRIRNGAFSQSGGNYIDIPGNRVINNYKTAGYTWSGINEGDGGHYYLKNLSDDSFITDAVIEKDDTAELTVMGNNYAISGLKVNESYNSHSNGRMILSAVTRGGKTPYTYTLKEGFELPSGLTLNESYGYISGKPTEVCGEGAVTVVVTDAEGETTEVNIGIGAVAVQKPVTGLVLSTSKLVLSGGGTGSLTATVNPADASITDVTFTSDDYYVAYIEGTPVKNDNITEAAIRAGIVGKAVITVNTVQGGRSTTCDVWVKEAIPEAECTSDENGIKLTGLSPAGSYKYGVKGSGETETGLADAFGAIGLDSKYYGKTIELFKLNEDPDLDSYAQEITVSATMPESISLVVEAPRTGAAPVTLDAVRYSSSTSPYYEISGISFSPNDETFVEGTSYNATVTISAIGDLLFESVPKISFNGKELSSGITCSLDKKAISVEYTFPAASTEINAETIELAKDEYILTIDGGSVTVLATVYPNNAANTDYTVSVADTQIAAVGLYNELSGVSAGKTTVTAVANGNDTVTDTADVYVRYPIPQIVWNKDRLTGFDPAETYEITPEGSSAVTPTVTEEGEVVIPDEWFNKKLSIVRKHGTYTKCDSEAREVILGDKPDISGSGLVAKLVDGNEYEYTGNKITPKIEAYNNGVLLTEGKDYKVKYSGNTKVTRDKNGNVISGGKATVTGTGNLKGTKTIEFKILPKSIGNGSSPASDISAGVINIVKGHKASAPVIYWGSYKLGASDYTLADASKKYNESGTFEVKVSGKGSYEGSFNLTLNVKDKKSDIKKLNVTVDTSVPLVYNPKSSETAVKNTISGMIKVYDSADKAKEHQLDNDSYILVFPDDITKAGTKTVTVVGKGSYNGNIRKKIAIKPLVVKDANENGRIETTADAIRNEYKPKYVAGGVTIPRDVLKVTYISATDQTTELVAGIDYKVTYSNNKAPSKAGKPAEYKITFLGNYKGTPALKNSKTVKKYSFEIEAAYIADGYGNAAEGFVAYSPDVAYTGKAGTYYSAPVVTYNGATFPSSNYTVKYFIETNPIDGFAQEVTKKKPIILADGVEYVTVQFRVIAKGSTPGKGNFTGTITGYYKVKRTKDTVYDLSKARVTIYGKDYISGSKKNKKLSGIPYTGKARKVSDKDPSDEKPYGTVVVEYKGSDGKYKTLTEDTDYKLTYMNNINKGKAVILIEGIDKDPGETMYVGNKRTTFSIVVRSITDWLQIL